MSLTVLTGPVVVTSLLMMLVLLVEGRSLVAGVPEALEQHVTPLLDDVDSLPKLSGMVGVRSTMREGERL